MLKTDIDPALNRAVSLIADILASGRKDKPIDYEQIDMLERQRLSDLRTIRRAKQRDALALLGIK